MILVIGELKNHPLNTPGRMVYNVCDRVGTAFEILLVYNLLLGKAFESNDGLNIPLR